jgi:hypothetical protein
MAKHLITYGKVGYVQIDSGRMDGKGLFLRSVWLIARLLKAWPL